MTALNVNKTFKTKILQMSDGEDNVGATLFQKAVLELLRKQGRLSSVEGNMMFPPTETKPGNPFKNYSISQLNLKVWIIQFMEFRKNRNRLSEAFFYQNWL